jgi:hypothetical protein
VSKQAPDALRDRAALMVTPANPELVDELGAFLQRLSCVVERLDERTLGVSLPATPIAEAAQLELDLYLRLWEVHHPDAPVARLY